MTLTRCARTFFVVAGFSFKTAFPFRIKIHDGALEECAFVAAELAPEQRFANGLHVAVHAEVAAVDRDFGKGAARAGRTGGIPKFVPHELAHQAGVLSVVVECEITQAVDVSLFVGVIELHLERRAGGVLRAEEAFFAQAHLGIGHAVDRHAGLDVRVRGRGWLELAARRQGVLSRSPLVTDLVPVRLGEGDLDFKQAILWKQLVELEFLGGCVMEGGGQAEANGDES